MKSKDKFEKLRSEIQFEQIGRWFVKKGKYIVDKRIVWAFMLSIIILSSVVVIQEGGLGQNKVFIECPSESMNWCKNPLYGQGFGLLYEIEVLAPGTFIGERPSKLYLMFPSLCLGLAFLAFILNTFLYNSWVVQEWREYELKR